MRLSDGTEIEYAAGLYVTAWRGVREVSHSGSTAWYRAFLARYPDQKLSVAVLCNAGSANATRLARDVAGLYLGSALQPRQTPPTITLDREMLQARSGVYRDDQTGQALFLRIKDGKLVTDDSTTLDPIGPTSFVFGGDGARVDFLVDARGRTTGFRVLSPRGEVESCTAKPTASPTEEQLRAYAGRYRSDEAETELVAAIDNGQLVLRRRPDTVFRLTPAWADAFASQAGTVQFRRGTDGRVHELSLSGARMYDLRFRRVE
jgi:hypothetical protein